MYKLLGVRKIATSACHPNGNGGVERVNRTMAQMLVMVVNERQDNWDVPLPHVEFANNNAVSAATGLAPNEVHVNRLPRLPLTIFEYHYARGHQSLARDHLEYCDLAADRGVRMRWFANNTPSLSPEWSAVSAVIPRSPTRSNNSLSTPSAAGYGSTTPLLPFARALNPAQTSSFSRRSHRLTGWVLSRS